MTLFENQKWSVRRTIYGPVVENGAEEAVCLVYLPVVEKGETYASAVARCDKSAALIAASPDMARALLQMGEIADGQWHTRECWTTKRGCIIRCQDAAAALKKAGIL
jgi:hypothetical protein